MNKKNAPRKERGKIASRNSTTRRPSKTARVLSVLYHGGTLNRFQAERLGDHCLNSTISTLANSHGIMFRRVPERVPTRFGVKATVTRYSLSPSSKARARAFLERAGAFSKRGQ